MNLRFSPDTEGILRAAGWFPGRRVDVTAWTARLESEGIRCFPAAAAALAALGGLHVKPPPRPRAPVAPTDVLFDPVAAASGEADRSVDWQRAAGVPLFPLGEAYGFRCLLLGLNEHVYVDHEVAQLALVGRSFGEAADALFLGTRRPTRLGAGDAVLYLGFEGGGSHSDQEQVRAALGGVAAALSAGSPPTASLKVPIEECATKNCGSLEVLFQVADARHSTTRATGAEPARVTGLSREEKVVTVLVSLPAPMRESQDTFLALLLRGIREAIDLAGLKVAAAGISFAEEEYKIRLWEAQRRLGLGTLD